MSDGKVHSRFGGSRATRFINCAGSVVMETLAPPPAPAQLVYSDEGTLAHDFGAWCLQNGHRSARPFIGQRLDGRMDRDSTISRDTANGVQFWLDACWDEFDLSPDAIMLVEHDFILPSEVAPGQAYGRGDCVIYHPSLRRLWIADYKHGVGYGVSVKDNAQDKFYATGEALTHTDWALAEVVCAIVQPRDWRNNYFEDSEGEVRTWRMPAEQIIEFHAEIEAAIERCLQAEATFIGVADGQWGDTFLKPGSWCDWCPAHGGVCPAQQAFMEKELRAVIGCGLIDIDDLGVNALPDPKDMPADKVGRLLNALELLKPYHKQVFDTASGFANANTEVTGWKLAEKIGRAKWQDADEEIAAYLEVVHGIDVTDTLKVGICTITEAEALLKEQFRGNPKGFAAAKEELRLRYTIKESSGLTLVRSDNRRDGVDKAAVATAGLQGL